MQNAGQIAEDSDPTTGPWGLSARWRYWISLFLLLLVAGSLYAWFQLHIQSYLARSLFVGVPLSVLALLKLAGSLWPNLPFANLKEFSKRVLASRSALGYLLFASVLVFALFLFTSSVYVEFEGSTDSGPFTVEVWRIPKETGLPVEKANATLPELVMPPLRITSYDRVMGAPFFFPFDRVWGPVDLEFRIVDPPRYEHHVERDLRPWRPVYLYIPGEFFPPKKYRIVRLIPVPGSRLVQLQPRVDESERSSHSLVIAFDEHEYRVEHLRLEVVYFGDRRDVIEFMEKADTYENRFHAIHTYLVRTNEETTPGSRMRWKPEKIHECAQILASSTPRIQETTPLNAASEFVVSVHQRQGDGTNRELLKLKKKVSSASGIQNVFLD